MDTAKITEPVRDQLQKLGALRDEMRVRIHLAGLDARAAFEKLEAQALHLEQRAVAAGDEARQGVADAIEKLSASLHDLKKRIEQPRA